MIIKRKIPYITAYLFFVFSASFIANISKLSPIYFSIFIICYLIFFYLAQIFSKKNYKKNYSIMSIVIFITLVLTLQMFFNSISAYFDYLLYIISFLYLPLGLILLNDISFCNLKKIIKSYYFLTSLLLILDFLNRVKFRDNYYVGLQYFYNFKKNGIMFQDSNFSGFLAMINFCFALYLKDNKIIYFSKIKLLTFFLLIVLNLSRAAILASLIGIIYSWFEKKSKKIRLYFFFLFVLIIPFISISLFNLFFNDDSFGTKIAIFEKTFNYLKDASIIQLLFGNGIFSSPKFLVISGHNYISQVIVEFGLIIFILQMVLFFSSLIYTKGKSFYIILPYFVAGLSMAPINIPYFYAMIAMIILIEENNNGFNFCNNACLQC